MLVAGPMPPAILYAFKQASHNPSLVSSLLLAVRARRLTAARKKPFHNASCRNIRRPPPYQEPSSYRVNIQRETKAASKNKPGSAIDTNDKEKGNHRQAPAIVPLNLNALLTALKQTCRVEIPLKESLSRLDVNVHPRGNVLAHAPHRALLSLVRLFVLVAFKVFVHWLLVVEALLVVVIVAVVEIAIGIAVPY